MTPLFKAVVNCCTEENNPRYFGFHFDRYKNIFGYLACSSFINCFTFGQCCNTIQLFTIQALEYCG